jgi:hypothetical protein
MDKRFASGGFCRRPDQDGLRRTALICATAPGGAAPGGTAPGGTAPGGTAPGGTTQRSTARDHTAKGNPQ